MKLYGGMDLHSTNVVTKLIDEEDNVVYRKKQGCDLEQILKGLEPFQDNIEGIAVESTFNWYWLVRVKGQVQIKLYRKDWRLICTQVIHADIESHVADGALAEVVWGNHDIIDRRLCDLGEARDLPEWFARWKGALIEMVVST